MRMLKANYFSHDQNARHDPNLVLLRLELGWEAVGIYWGIIEILSEQPSLSLDERNAGLILAEELHLSKQKVEDLLRVMLTIGGEADSRLLVIRKGRLLSESLIRRIEQAIERQGKMRELGRKGANTRWGDDMPGAMPGAIASAIASANSDAIARKGKESKPNQIKPKKEREAIPNDAKSIFEYMKQIRSDLSDQKLRAEALAFFDHHSQRHWIPKGASKQMSDWRAAVRTWFRKAVEFGKLPAAPRFVKCQGCKQDMPEGKYREHAASCADLAKLMKKGEQKA